MAIMTDCCGWQGVYVLTDNNFRPFTRMSTDAGGQAIVRAQPVSSLVLDGILFSSNCSTAVPLVSLRHRKRSSGGLGYRSIGQRRNK